MNILLINDTSLTNNPGCFLTVKNLIGLYESYGHRIIYRLPLGAGYEIVKEPILRRLLKSKNWLGVKLLRSRLATLIPESVIKSVDAVIINGEGSIHHGSTAEKIILNLCVYLKTKNKKIFLVNCTMQDLETESILILKSTIDYICARETATFDYLKSLDVPVHRGADALFLEEWIKVNRPPNNRKICIYTPGVLSSTMHFHQIEEKVDSIKTAGFRLIYLPIEIEDLKHAKLAGSLGMNIGDFPVRNSTHLYNILSSASLIITGRYHIAIASLMINIPFIPCATNTWKIDGLINLLKIDPFKIPETTEFCGSVSISDQTRGLARSLALLNYPPQSIIDN